MHLAASPSMASKNDGKRQARHAARAIQTSHEAARWVQDTTGLEDVAQAMTALEVVAGGIVRRLTAAEANDFISQLPSELHDTLLDLPAGPDRSLTLETIQTDLAQRLELEPGLAAGLVRGVGIAIRRLVSKGEIDDVLSQLPLELRELLPDEVAHPTP
jgi:uncharacterized protein (DUF2267 family)